MSIISLQSITKALANRMPILRLGSQGEPVIILQQYLYRIDRYDGFIDGNFNLKTYDAIRAFQKEVGIFPRGIVDQPTWQAIIEYYAALKISN